MSSSDLCSSAQSLADHMRRTHEYFETVVGALIAQWGRRDEGDVW